MPAGVLTAEEERLGHLVEERVREVLSETLGGVLQALVQNPPKLALSIKELAAASGYGETTIRSAIDDGDIVVRYGTKTKPIIETTEALAWIRSLPTRPPKQ